MGWEQTVRTYSYEINCFGGWFIGCFGFVWVFFGRIIIQENQFKHNKTQGNPSGNEER